MTGQKITKKVAGGSIAQSGNESRSCRGGYLRRWRGVSVPRVLACMPTHAAAPINGTPSNASVATSRARPLATNGYAAPRLARSSSNSKPRTENLHWCWYYVILPSTPFQKNSKCATRGPALGPLTIFLWDRLSTTTKFLVLTENDSH